MEENRYYVPNIEEFHVGFEYERLKSKPVYDNEWKFDIRKNIFSKELWKSSYSNWDLFDALRDFKIRVKYIDKEDIESLGFVKRGDINQYDLRGSNYIITINNEKLSVHIVDHNDTIVDTLFKGTVKNKSELKFILDRNGIKNKS